jgi:hypothetical protein
MATALCSTLLVMRAHNQAIICNACTLRHSHQGTTLGVGRGYSSSLEAALLDVEGNTSHDTISIIQTLPHGETTTKSLHQLARLL